MNWVKTLFTKTLPGLLHHPPSLDSIEKFIEAQLPNAVKVVQEIDALAPNKTLEEFNIIATKYALPAITAFEGGQTPGNIALNLGSQILAKNHAPAAATSLLNTLIQFAVIATKPPAVPA